MVKRYSESFGKPISVHKLRHSFATRMAAQSESILDVMAQLGHLNVQTTTQYVHVNDDKLKRTIDLID